MIRWSLCDGVYELELARPPCNEIGTTVLGEIERFLDIVDTASASALIIHSGLSSGFSAGADLRELYAALQDVPPGQIKQGLRAFIDRVHTVMDRLDALPLTTIAVVSGICFGGGFELALTSDIIIAEKTARFCFPELRLGLIPGFGGIPRLRRDVSNGLVRDLLLTGRSINAKKAQACGLVSQMVPTGEGLRAARAAARQATKFDPLAQRTCKAFMKPIPYEDLAREREIFVNLASRPVLLAALKKFVESDDPRPYLP